MSHHFQNFVPLPPSLLNNQEERQKQYEFPTPKLLREANVEYAIENSGKDQGSALSTKAMPLPVPTTETKADILREINCKHIDSRAKDKKTTLAHLEETLSSLVNVLCQDLQEDVEKVRMLFVWLATYDLNELDEINPPIGSVREQLLQIPREKHSRTRLFIKMCRLAELETKEIRGVFRDTSIVGREHLNATSSWAAVLIDQSWRLFDPNPASVKTIPASQQSESDDWILIDNNSTESCERQKNTQSTLDLSYNDHFFLTDPEAFIFTHFPSDKKWQLLARPVTRQEFDQLAYLNPSFFETGLTLESHRKVIIESPNGEVDIVVGMTNRNINNKHELWMRKKSKNQPDIGEPNRFVLRQVKGNEILVHLEFPAPGKYQFILFAESIDSYELQSALKYMINNKTAKKNIEPLPINVRQEWGPGLDLMKAKLEPISHDDAVVKTEKGVVQLTFKAYVRVELTHSLHSNKHSKEGLKNYIIHHHVKGNLVVDARLPSAGQFALNLFAGEADKHMRSLPNVCTYLLTSNQGEFDAQPFPEMPNGFVGVTSAGRDAGVECTSHEAAIIETPESGYLDINLNLPEFYQIDGKLYYQAGYKTLNMTEFVLTKMYKNGEAQFSMQLPEAGFYSLKVFGTKNLRHEWTNVYNFLINVPTPEEFSVFPKTYPSFKLSKCRLQAPITGTLPANQTIPFAIEVPNSHGVATLSSKGLTQLIQSEDGMWRGDVETGDPNSVFSVGARIDGKRGSFTYILKYQVALAKREDTANQGGYNDVQRTLQVLLDAIDACDTKALVDVLNYIKAEGYETYLGDEIHRAEDLIKSLDRIEKLTAAILKTDIAVFAIKGYYNPPMVIHDVMVATLLLLGEDEDKTREWVHCHRLCTAIRDQGLLGRVRDFEFRQLHPAIAAQAKWILSRYSLDEVRRHSAAVANFYSWTKGIAEELKMVIPGSEYALPAGLQRQKEIFRRQKHD